MRESTGVSICKVGDFIVQDENGAIIMEEEEFNELYKPLSKKK